MTTPMITPYISQEQFDRAFPDSAPAALPTTPTEREALIAWHRHLVEHGVIAIVRELAKATADMLTKMGTEIEDLQGVPKEGWKPIETAPREQEVFIGAFIDGKFKFGRSEQFYEQANVMEGETFSGWVWSVDDCSESIAEKPEFWTPLLRAPRRTT